MDKEMHFVVFCLENYKIHRKLTGKAVYDLFAKYGVIEYLYEFYDVLHTTGHNYINDDIDDFLKNRGVIFA